MSWNLTAARAAMRHTAQTLQSLEAPRWTVIALSTANSRRSKVLGKLKALPLDSRILAASAAVMLLVTGTAALWGAVSSSPGIPAIGSLQAEITQSNLDYAQGTGNGVLDVYVPYSYLTQLVGSTGEPVVAIDHDPPWTDTADIDPAYIKSDVEFTWHGPDGREDGTKISLQNLANRSLVDSPVLTRSVSFQLAGSPSSYPSDQWEIPLDLVVSWPAGVHKAVSLGFESDNETIPPVTMKSYSGLNVHVEDGKAVLTRPFAAQCLLYTVTLTPLLLAFAAIVSRRKAKSGTAEAPLELAAALISIFALRSVLVPSDLPGLTSIDYLLAVQTVTIISAATMAVAFRPSSTAQP